jgi:poly(A) polymerase
LNLKSRTDITPTLRIIPRDQHIISRKNISKAALRVLYRLNEAGYTAYLVGGAVRDLLLGLQPKDFDVATSATPDEVKKLFRNCRLIGRRFRLAHVVFGPEIIEVATFRGLGEEGGEGDRHIVDGRIVRDNIWGTIEEDAVRRDFRVNAMYYDISDFSVRDLVLGLQPKDFDVATSATPDEVKKLFRNCRLIGRRFRLAHVVFGPEIIEVATFRGTGEEGGEGDRHIVDGRIVRDNIWGTIEEDAVRRDFRVNAMYYDISDFSVRDYVGGMQDLDDRVLRLIGDPDVRYHEDPVRMLRAARLAAKLGMRIDAAAMAPFETLGPLLADAAPARLFDESLKMFLSGNGLKSFRMLEQCGLLKFLFPATARALKRGDEALRALVEHGLANTDARIAEGKSVTPAFLFAVLLWGEVRDVAHQLIGRGVEGNEAWSRAAGQVVGEQCQRVAIPRRFTFTMEEIWSLQPRFEQVQRKRVFRLMTHPRFRAAFDFLLLRADESPAMRELGQWWAHAQQLPQDVLAAALPAGGGSEHHAVAPVAAKPPRPRRRRRKPGNKSGSV